MSRTRVLVASLLALPLFVVAGAPAPAAAADAHGVLICHHAGQHKLMQLTVGESAVASHVQMHGDTIGSCKPDGGGDGGGDTL